MRERDAFGRPVLHRFNKAELVEDEKKEYTEENKGFRRNTK